ARAPRAAAPHHSPPEVETGPAAHCVAARAARACAGWRISVPLIRPATPADLSALGAALAPLPLFQAYRLTAPALTQRFEAALQRGEGLLLAELDGAPVGVCWFIARGAFGTGAYLRTLAVKEGLQGQGIGVELLR